MALDLQYDRSLLGKEHRAGPFEVTRELIRAFADALGEINPLYLDEAEAREAGYPTVLAPPALCTVFVHDVTIPDINLNFGSVRFHAGQVVEPRAPVLAGDSLMASSQLKEVYPKTGRSGTMVFIVWETTFTNQRGDIVAAVQESYAVREQSDDPT